MQQLVHLARVDPAACHRHDAGHRPPVLVEVEAAGGVGRDVSQPAGVVVAAGGARVPLELADHRAGVDVVHAQQPAPLGDDPEADAVGLLPGVGGVAGPVQVQEHPVGAGPVRHRMQRGIADGEVDHDDHAAEFFREFGALVHVLHGGRGDVQVMALDLAGLLGGAVYRLHDEQVAVPPAHERLGIDVLVVLGEIQPAAQRLVDHAAVVAGGQTELGLSRGAEQRAAVLVQVLAFGDDAVRRALEGFGVVAAGCGDPPGGAL